ncbi:MAG: HAMP domain-containing histidine kinase [Patescibacteria group bacterium]|nr:HAMP domain-containing histidine kinase [Patescibacteria group bacterium]
MAGILASVGALFGGGRISRKDFFAHAFKTLRKSLNDSSTNQDYLAAEKVIAQPLTSESETEQLLIQLYLKLEKYISETQEGRRVPKETLRENIRRSCNPELAAGDFPLLFLPPTHAAVRLFESYTQEILDRLGHTWQPAEMLRYFEQLNPALATLKAKDLDHIDWLDFEQQVARSQPKPDENFRTMKQIFSGAIAQLLELSKSNFEALRAERVFSDAYDLMKRRFGFLDNVAAILDIIPASIMKQEHMESLPKETLINELRKRNEDLEFALTQLKEEKGNLETEHAKLAEALQNLQALDKAKGDFINVISHQFRTPLSAIRWNNDLLMETSADIKPPETSEQMLTAEKAIFVKAVFLINILDDIYDVLAIEGKQVALEYRPSLVWELVDDAVGSIKDEAKVKNIQIAFNRDQSQIKTIQLDPQKIKRVFLILLRNAVNYSSAGNTVTISITPTTLNNEPAVACSIRDTGIGISPEDQAKLFTKFFRAKNAIAAVADGAGLGLYLVKNFVEAHRGTVTVASELGKGSTFTVTIPEK